MEVDSTQGGSVQDPGPSGHIMVDVDSQRDAILEPPAGLSSFETVAPQKEPVRDLCVKVHVRRTGKDAWTYLGRAFVSQELVGHSAQTSRVVVRSAASNKILTSFSENSDLQAEKRGNFVIISCVEGSEVVSWSLNTMNNSETLRLLATVELASYKCRQALADPKNHGKIRRRIERTIREDRRRRHRRRREEEAMVTAFERQHLS